LRKFCVKSICDSSVSGGGLMKSRSAARVRKKRVFGAGMRSETGNGRFPRNDNAFFPGILLRSAGKRIIQAKQAAA
jgi:hypothetical protein